MDTLLNIQRTVKIRRLLRVKNPWATAAMRRLCVAGLSNMHVRAIKNQAGETEALLAYAGMLNGKKRRKRFSVKKLGGLARAQASAEAWARAKAKQIESNASFGALIDERLLAQVSEAIDLLGPYRISLIEAVRAYVAGQGAAQSSQSAPIRAWTWTEAVDAFLENLRHGARTKDYIRDCETQYGAFARDFGGRSLDEITTEQLQAWLSARKNDAGKQLSVTTRNNWRRDLGMVWRFAHGRGRAASNPAALLPRGKADDGPIAILSPTEAELALRTAERLGKRNYVLFLALSCFAGLRTIEVKRLQSCNIHLDRRIIIINTRISKTRQRRIPTIPENLACWLERYRGHGGNKVLEPGGGYTKVMRRVLKEAGAPTIPSNAMRHSWFSYHLALGQNEDRTQYEGGHESAEVLYKNYRELVTPEEARAWFAIYPSSSA